MSNEHNLTLVQQLADEFTERIRRGERPSIQEYVVRHPELAEIIRDTFEALAVIEDLAPDSNELHDDAGQDRKALTGDVALRHLGDYRIVREVGRGGMGIVYEAEQLSLGRQVALKVLPLVGILDHKQIQRFKNEAQAAALLHHQNIVPVHGIGTERGVHYYAMQYVEGQTLAEVIRCIRRIDGVDGKEDLAAIEPTIARSLVSGQLADLAASPAVDPTYDYAPPGATPTRGLDPVVPLGAASPGLSTKAAAYFRSIAQLGIQVAEALEHAHSEGIIHRDIKPSNLILDANGKLWVTDFGLARVETNPELTMTGDILGTLRYMSPEQALGKRIVVDHRTDIYSFSVTWYEMLALRPAFSGSDRAEVLRQIAFEEPKNPRRVRSSVPADLETIILKGMSKNPAERYDTAQQLADDLRRFLEHEPIRARRPTLVQRATKWSHRNPSWVISTFVVLAVCVVALSTSTTLISHSRNLAVDNQRQATMLAGALDQKFQEVEKIADDQRAVSVRLMAKEAMRLQDQGDMAGSLPWLAAILEVEQDQSPRTQLYRTHLACALVECPRPSNMWFHDAAVADAVLSADGRFVASAGRDGTAQIWNVQSGSSVTPPLVHDAGVKNAGFSPDGRRLVTGTLSGTVRVWDALTGEPVTPWLKHQSEVTDVSFSPDGQFVISASKDGTARIWDAETGFPTIPPLQHESWVNTASFSPDGRFVLTASGNEDSAVGDARIWDATSGKLAVPVLKHRGRVWSASFNSDGTRVITACQDHTARIWNSATGRIDIQPLNLGQIVSHASFSPDGRYVLAASRFYGMVHIWDVATGNIATKVAGFGAFITDAVFSPDSSQVVVAYDDGRTQAWGILDGAQIGYALKHGAAVNSVSLSADGRFVLTASEDQAVRMWDLATAGPLASATMRHRQAVEDAEFDTDGRRIVTASADGTARTSGMQLQASP